MSNKIIKIHGCSGAGKTTAARGLLETATAAHVIRTDKGKIEAYELILPGVLGSVFVLGSYENTCGGVDGISDYKDVLALLEKYHPRGHVVFEGLLQSTYYGAMGKHSVQFGKDYVYAFLDTPIEVCLQRVETRRAARGNKGKFNPQNTRDKHETVAHVATKVRGYGHTVVTLKHDESMVPQLLEILK